MNATLHERLDLNSEEFVILSALLDSERTKLLVEIRHTTHRSFRKELRHRLAVLEGMIEHCQSPALPSREEVRSAE